MTSFGTLYPSIGSGGGSAMPEITGNGHLVHNEGQLVARSLIGVAPLLIDHADGISGATKFRMLPQSMMLGALIGANGAASGSRDTTGVSVDDRARSARYTIASVDVACGCPLTANDASGFRIVANTAGSADLVAYVGHNGLMDFKLSSHPKRRDDRERRAIILACASKSYFSPALQQSGATPLLWTTNLMAPEAYVLSAAIDAWMKKEKRRTSSPARRRSLQQVSALWHQSSARLIRYGLVTEL